ncbi:MAG: fasciclin domain-containing protein, partial [Myxococcota bacterium]
MLRTAWLGLGLTLMGCPMEDNDKDSGDAPEPAGNTIVDIASADPNFSTLVGLLNDDLVETLSGPGPFTVFAPTNDAFAGVDTSGLSDEQIVEILTYHVVPGSVGSTEIPAVVDSVATFTLFFDTTDGVQVNDATVIDADIAASNGIIHVIDDVLLPPNILDAAG